MRNRQQTTTSGILRVIGVAMIAALVSTAQGETDQVAAAETITIDGLEWALATNGDDITWPEAVEYCAALSVDGHDDWRLPSLAELEMLHDAESDEGIRNPFVIGGCCLWSSVSLVERPAADGDEIAGRPEMYHWGFMFDGGFPYYAVHIFDDGRALCTRDAGTAAE